MTIYTDDFELPCTWEIKTDNVPAHLGLIDCRLDTHMKAIVAMSADNTMKLELVSGPEYPDAFIAEAIVCVK